MKGFKVFNPDWTCREFQFEVGKVFEQDVKPVCCKSGFHFCKKVSDCFNYYEFDSKNRVAEIEALGDIDAENENRKYCTNKIRIVRELSWHEVLDLVNTGSSNTGLGNTGNNNTGNCNIGNYNDGDYNNGSYNIGNRNTGDYNIGNRNTGDNNSGYCNTGNRNTGCCNVGNYNIGNYNTGDNNSGHWNSGNYNKGNHNTGNNNAGEYNSGHLNSGNHNDGNHNSGHHNTGNRNSGNYNTGYWNSGNYNTGCFNSKSPKINMFDKKSNWTFSDWYNSNAIHILEQMPSDNFMNERQKWWDSLPNSSKEIVMNLPNFDKAIFKKITGIKIKDKN